MTIQEFLTAIKGTDADARYQAWKSAGPHGAGAVAGLGEAMASGNRWIARAARLALENIAHHAARPGARKEAQTVTAELIKLTGAAAPLTVRSHAIYLLGCVAEGRTAGELGRLLGEADVREEARLALERLPGRDAHRVLERAQDSAAADFKAALQQSLQNRNTKPNNVGIKAA